MKVYNIYIHGKWIDTTFFSDNVTKEEAYDNLVNHDGYDPEIVVRAAQKNPRAKKND